MPVFLCVLFCFVFPSSRRRLCEDISTRRRDHITCRPWARGTCYLNSRVSSCNKPAREDSHTACLMPLGALVGEGEVKFLKDKGRGAGLLVNPNLENKKGTKTFIKGKPDFHIYPERSQKLWVHKQGYRISEKSSNLFFVSI